MYMFIGYYYCYCPKTNLKQEQLVFPVLHCGTVQPNHNYRTSCSCQLPFSFFSFQRALPSSSSSSLCAPGNSLQGFPSQQNGTRKSGTKFAEGATCFLTRFFEIFQVLAPQRCRILNFHIHIRRFRALF